MQKISDYTLQEISSLVDDAHKDTVVAHHSKTTNGQGVFQIVGGLVDAYTLSTKKIWWYSILNNFKQINCHLIYDYK